MRILWAFQSKLLLSEKNAQINRETHVVGVRISKCSISYALQVFLAQCFVTNTVYLSVYHCFNWIQDRILSNALSNVRNVSRSYAHKRILNRMGACILHTHYMHSHASMTSLIMIMQCSHWFCIFFVVSGNVIRICMHTIFISLILLYVITDSLL